MSTLIQALGRRKRLRVVITILLALLGLVDSIYLLTIHWSWLQAICLGVGECEVVNASIYSELLGIPVAMLGALAYLSIIGTCILNWRRVSEDYAARVQFFIATVGVAFSAYLTYIELFVLRAICPWCMLSAILITLIAALSAWELIESSEAYEIILPYGEDIRQMLREQEKDKKQ